MGGDRAERPMSGAHILAVGAVSALGSGKRAYRVGEVGERATVAITHDVALEREGLSRPIAARVEGFAADRDRASALLAAALRQCIAGLDPASLAQKRIGLAIGTSSGGMLTMERFFAAVARGDRIARPLARGATYFAPLEDAERETGLSFSPRVLVLGACASSTLAIGLALRWLALGRCDIALAGGFDALGAFVASGFEALRATTATLPRPFRVGRDGMALGEGAGVVALAREPGPSSHGFVAGFAASTDALHLTAPDQMGRGLGTAGARAIEDAGVGAETIDLVSAHATATPFNDPAETRALRRALGDRAPKVVHPFKAQIGHTLGAAGVLESLAALDALERRIAPAAAGEGDVDPECAVPLAETHERLESRAALKLSSAFGGANAALVLTSRSTPGRAVRPGPVFVRALVTVSESLDARSLAAAVGARHPHLHRLDAMASLVITAVHRLSLVTGGMPIAGTGLVLGHTLATLEPNELFDVRRREKGARAVEPRRFPATSPNAAAGECAIAFGLTGPTFAVGGSLHGGLEALDVAKDLVSAGDARSMLVVAADLAGSVSSALAEAAGTPALPAGACACLLEASDSPGAVALEVPPVRSLEDGPNWIWSGPCGHRELASYLGRLGPGVTA
jgi:3-oxoacyl-[acyl-carrier-protein] synthase-1/3-oxoacyl-[acyl-carrier-protein] synthase II